MGREPGETFPSKPTKRHPPPVFAAAIPSTEGNQTVSVSPPTEGWPQLERIRGLGFAGIGIPSTEGWPQHPPLLPVRHFRIGIPSTEGWPQPYPEPGTRLARIGIPSTEGWPQPLSCAGADGVGSSRIDYSGKTCDRFAEILWRATLRRGHVDSMDATERVPPVWLRPCAALRERIHETGH
jgi:hypothetical protein